MPERVVFQTKDQVVIVGSFVTAPAAARAALLIHMMPADRTSWESFQQALAERGVASLAIDLRGHGESTVQDGRRIDYRSFSDEQHQASSEDIRAALKWLETRGFLSSHVALVGASIGANLVLNAAVSDSDIPAVALLSPGENFRGVLTSGAAEQLKPAQSIWAAGSQGDDQESYDAAKHLVETAASKEKLFVPFTSAGHGTLLFQSHPDLINTLADWIHSHLH